MLYDCMVGDSTLFHRTDMVDAAWKAAQPIIDGWAANPPTDFPNYAPGEWGPPAAELITRDGHTWWVEPKCIYETLQPGSHLSRPRGC
jgi:glucose-6-phosphate 1-dehydrogenase